MQNESGRSLVEMLGALAVMGILSMAGIWAYNTAMDKLKANTIINEAQKRAVVIAGQIGLMGSTHPTLGEFKENTFGGGTFSTNVTTEGLYKQFGIQVSGVSKRICQNILNSIDDGTPIRRLSNETNPTSNISTCQDNNSFLIVYNNDLSSSNNDVEYTNDGCNCQTACGQCVIEKGIPSCVNECPISPNACSSHQDCSGHCVGCVKENGQATGTCQACERVEYLESTGTQYIDTGISNWNETFEYEIKLGVRQQDSGTHTYFGAWNAWSTSGTAVPAIGTYYNLKLRKNFIPQTTAYDIGVTLGQTGVIFLKGNTLGWSRGSSIAFDRSAKIFTNSYSLYLFACNRAGNVGEYSTFPMYYAKLWLNGNQVRDFVPVYAPFQPTGKQNCMYDKISKSLFCNVASGEDFKTNRTP